ncbi:hypothetical protein [Ekhidna sp.]
MKVDAPIHEYDGIEYIIVDQVKDSKDFMKWLDGQTVPDIPDIEAAYVWDYQRYMEYRALRS